MLSMLKKLLGLNNQLTHRDLCELTEDLRQNQRLQALAAPPRAVKMSPAEEEYFNQQMARLQNMWNGYGASAAMQQSMLNAMAQQMQNANPYLGPYSGGMLPPVSPPEIGEYAAGNAEMAKQTTQPVMTPIGTLSYQNLFEAKPRFEGGTELAFSAALIFDEDAQKTDAYKAMRKAVGDCAKAFFGDKLPSNFRSPFRDGAEKEDKAGYREGVTFINAWTKSQPGVIGPKKEDLLSSDVWSGQKARFIVRPFAYNKSGNAGVSFALDAVQIASLKEERLDGRTNAKKAFGDLDTGSSSDDDDLPF